MKKKIAKDVLRKYKELLVKERGKLAKELLSLKKDSISKSQKDASGELSGYAFHMADMASDNYDRDFSMGIATEEQKRLYAIEEALKRIRDGAYGDCLTCGKRISQQRLSAIPYTELCIECQKSQEKRP